MRKYIYNKTVRKTKSALRVIAIVALIVASLSPLVMAKQGTAEPLDKIVFTDGDTRTLALMDPDGTGYQNLGQMGESPSLSPDGTKIIFYDGGARHTPLRVFVANSDGTNKVDLTPSILTTAYFPTWSPDGSKIAMFGIQPDGIRGIYIMNSDGSDPKLAVENAIHSSWSPDGTHITFEIHVNGAREIGTAKIDGTEFTVLTGGGFNDSPAWSSDNRIAWGSINGLSVMNPDGSGRVDLLTNLDSVNGPPQWSPDSSTIIYAGGYGIFYQTDSHTGEQQQIGTEGHYITNPSWGNLLVLDNYAPIVHPLSPVTTNDGVYSYNGTFSDPDSTSWAATVDYGDGTGVQPLILSGNNFSLSHNYTQTGTYTVTVSATDDGQATGSARGFVDVTAVPLQRPITALAPAKVWVGLKNGNNPGLKFDLRAEAYKDSTLVSYGELNGVPAGGPGFHNANLNTIDFNAFSPVDFPAGSVLSVKVYVRNACVGSTSNSGIARLWYDDSAANSQFGATIDASSADYFLRDGFALATTAGPGPKKIIDVQSGDQCSPFKQFGSWSVTP